MANWWKFEGPDYAEPFKARIRGTDVNVLPSPYDVPELFRTYVDAQLNRWVVEFKYINKEPLVAWQASDILRLWLGQNSLRVYRIEAPQGLAQDPQVQFAQQISNALTQLENDPKMGAAAANYEFVRMGILNPHNSILTGTPAG
jgi:hypothetical protein